MNKNLKLMKKLFTSLFAVAAISAASAQIGATAPDFTVVDINGNSHNLYTYLNSGKVVLLDVSATWCGPCWNFHNAHYLEDLYTEFGPNGTNEVVVLFYEGDAATAANALNGTGGSTQGDWVTGTPYPIINEAPLQLSLNIYAPLGFPTINVISCADKKIKWDLWDSQAGTQTQSLANMRAKVQEVIDQCQASASTNELPTIEASLYPNPTNDVVSLNLNSVSDQDIKIEIYSVTGQVVQISMLKAGNQSVELNLNTLENGSYYIKVSAENLQSNLLKVVKQ